jgi:hypothetical protein
VARNSGNPALSWEQSERDLLARGMFKSIPDLARKIRRYIRRYNEEPKPIRWTYSNPTLLIQLLQSTSFRVDRIT